MRNEELPMSDADEAALDAANDSLAGVRTPKSELDAMIRSIRDGGREESRRAKKRKSTRSSEEI